MGVGCLVVSGKRKQALEHHFFLLRTDRGRPPRRVAGSRIVGGGRPAAVAPTAPGLDGRDGVFFSGRGRAHRDPPTWAQLL